jgi:hypothetical protein
MLPLSLGAISARTALSSVNVVHNWWTYKRNIEIGKNYLVKTVVGASLQIGLNNIALRAATVAVIAGSRVLDFLDQNDKLNEAFKEFKDAINFTYPVNPQTRWDKKTSLDYVFTRQQIIWFINDIKAPWIRCKRIANSTFKLGKEFFNLTMRIIDILKIVLLNPADRTAFIDQISWETGYATYRCATGLVENKERILDNLNNEKRLLHRAIVWVGANPKELAENVEGLIDTLESALVPVKMVDSAVTTEVSGFFENGLNQIADIASRRVPGVKSVLSFLGYKIPETPVCTLPTHSPSKTMADTLRTPAPQLKSGPKKTFSTSPKITVIPTGTEAGKLTFEKKEPKKLTPPVSRELFPQNSVY